MLSCRPLSLLMLGLVASAAAEARPRVAVLEPGVVDYRLPRFGSCSVPGSPGCRVAAVLRCTDSHCEPSAAFTTGRPFDDDHADGVISTVLEAGPSAEVIALFPHPQAGAGWRHAAMIWIRDHAASERIVAVVRTDGAVDPDPSRPEVCLDAASAPVFSELAALGVVTVAAAGNQGFNGFRRPARKITPLACHPDVVGVGGTKAGAIDIPCVPVGPEAKGGVDPVPEPVTHFTFLCNGNLSDSLGMATGACAAGRAGTPENCGTSFAAPRIAGYLAELAACGAVDPLAALQATARDTVELATGFSYPVADPVAALASACGEPPPTVSATFEASCFGRVCTFDASGSRPLGLTFEWSFGDGSRLSGREAVVEHRYSTTAARVATLVASDGASVGSASRTVSPTPSASPARGNWYEPGRSGHGFDVQATAGGDLFIAWMTYTEAGRPTWLVSSSGPIGGNGNDWSQPLYATTWDGSSAGVSELGELSLRFRSTGSADADWAVAGDGRHAELAHLFGGGASTAHWYDPAAPGWGVLTATVPGSSQLIVAMLVYEGGSPVWVLGAATGDPASGLTVPVRWHEGSHLCPTCDGPPDVTTTPAGSVAITIPSPSSPWATVSPTITFPSGLRWTTGGTLWRLSGLP